MSDSYQYDIAVIGAGPAGYIAAIRAAQLGAQVCVIEKGEMGGVCTNAGCIPTKALWFSAKLLTEARNGAEFGLSGAIDIDFPAVAKRRDGIIAKLRTGISGLLKAAGVDVIRGAARFTDTHTLTIASAEETTVTADKVFIATGSSSVELPMAPFDHESIWDSSDAVSATELPASIVIIGGGYIGIEFASIYAACGVEVTVVEALDSILPLNDPDCAKLVARTLKKRGARLLTGVALKAVETTEAGVIATLADGNTVEAEKMLVCVGRRPDCTGLDIEKAGLETEANGALPVDEHMQTAVPGIYAIGDVAGGPLLAHAGSHEGVVAAAHATGTISASMDYKVMPACVFSLPEIASVGLSEAEAAEQVGEVVVKKFPFLALGKAHIHAATEGFVKMIADGRTGRVVGVHICGEGASLLIGEAALAVRLECTAEELARTIHAHPTMPEALHEAAEGIMGLPLNWRG